MRNRVSILLLLLSCMALAACKNHREEGSSVQHKFGAVSFSKEKLEDDCRKDIEPNRYLEKTNAMLNHMLSQIVERNKKSGVKIFSSVLS
jgi:predicted small secreted protein